LTVLGMPLSSDLVWPSDYRIHKARGRVAGLASLITEFYESDKIVSAVCHGTGRGDQRQAQ